VCRVVALNRICSVLDFAQLPKAGQAESAQGDEQQMPSAGIEIQRDTGLVW
jgi:hypothetical protein